MYPSLPCARVLSRVSDAITRQLPNFLGARSHPHCARISSGCCARRKISTFVLAGCPLKFLERGRYGRKEGGKEGGRASEKEGRREGGTPKVQDFHFQNMPIFALRSITVYVFGENMIHFLGFSQTVPSMVHSVETQSALDGTLHASHSHT